MAIEHHEHIPLSRDKSAWVWRHDHKAGFGLTFDAGGMHFDLACLDADDFKRIAIAMLWAIEAPTKAEGAVTDVGTKAEGVATNVG